MSFILIIRKLLTQWYTYMVGDIYGKLYTMSIYRVGLELIWQTEHNVYLSVSGFYIPTYGLWSSQGSFLSPLFYIVYVWHHKSGQTIYIQGSKSLRWWFYMTHLTTFHSNKSRTLIKYVYGVTEVTNGTYDLILPKVIISPTISVSPYPISIILLIKVQSSLFTNHNIKDFGTI